MKLTSMALVVKDAKSSANWYREKLGFAVTAQDGHWVVVGPKEMPVGFHLCSEHFPLEPGNTGVMFLTKDCAKDEKALKAMGVRITSPTKKESWGTYFMFADPDGNEFWVMEE